MPAADPTIRTANARIAALERWAHEDPKANAERGQAGLRDKFRREITAEHPELTEAEIFRRADCAYRAHMARIRRARTLKARTGRPDGEAA